MAKFRLAGRIDALKPFREAKLKGRVGKSELRWKLREQLGKASCSRKE